MESSEARLFAERAHLECCTEVRLFVACLFASGQKIRHFCLYVLYCTRFYSFGTFWQNSTKKVAGAAFLNERSKKFGDKQFFVLLGNH